MTGIHTSSNGWHFSFHHYKGTKQLDIQQALGNLHLETKQSLYGADHTPPSCAEGWSACKFTSKPSARNGGTMFS